MFSVGVRQPAAPFARESLASWELAQGGKRFAYLFPCSVMSKFYRKLTPLGPMGNFYPASCLRPAVAWDSRPKAHPHSGGNSHCPRGSLQVRLSNTTLL